MYQKTFVLGRLTRDPEMRFLDDGTAVTNLSLAVNERWTGRDGERNERVLWFRISVWGKMAEVVNEYLEKGREVFIEGRLNPDPETGNPRVYQRNDGTWGASYELRALNVTFVGGRGTATEGDEVIEEDESIPF